MFRKIDGEEFIAKIRSLDQSLSKIKLTGVEIDKTTREVTFLFICENTVSSEVRELIVAETKKNSAKCSW